MVTHAYIDSTSITEVIHVGRGLLNVSFIHSFMLVGCKFPQRDDTNIESVDLASDECGVFGEGRPYMFNKPWAIPGYIEAEYYDRGGPGVRNIGFTWDGFLLD